VPPDEGTSTEQASRKEPEVADIGAEIYLAEIAVAATDVISLRAAFQAAIDRRDEAIRSAFKAGVRRVLINPIAGVTPTQVNSITHDRYPPRRRRSPWRDPWDSEAAETMTQFKPPQIGG
jgi:hypothetical protein